jgi:hypothetical protein
MLLLINRRYPVLGSVLGVVVAIASITIGVATSRSIFVIMGAVSIAIAIARIAQRRRTSTAQVR